jgi:xanthine dehydrogenase accessory factor
VRLLIERIDARDVGWLADASRCRELNQTFEIRTRLAPRGLQKSVAPVGDRCDARPAVVVNGGAARAREARPMDGDEIVESQTAAEPELLLFGAGHVGQAIARALAPLPFRVSWYDSREEMADLPGVTLLAPDIQAEIARAGGDYTLVVTHDHAIDYALVSAALAGPGLGYLGLIGSRTKRARFLARLRADGFTEATLARLTCPIGIPELHDKAPEVIAVSVAADLLLRQQANQRLAADELSPTG